MNEQDDTKLWQILGHASQPAPGDDFARRVMMRIAGEEHATAVPAESIHHFKRELLPHLGRRGGGPGGCRHRHCSPDGTLCSANAPPLHRHPEH